MEINFNIKYIVSCIIGFVLMCAVFSGMYTVDQGERVVLLRNGAIVDTKEPGLHLKIPFIDTAKHISVQSVNLQYDKMATYSRDQQPAELRVSVNFRATPSQVETIYSTYGSLQGMVDRVLTPNVYKSTKEVFGRFAAAEVVQDRQRFGVEVYERLKQDIGDRMVIESIQVENIDFSNVYEQSVEQRMLAEVEVQKVKQNWEKEKVAADITRTKAQADADAKFAMASATAKSIEVQGAAEATAISAKGKALRDNPELVSLMQAEKWDGKLPTTMIPNSTLPFMNMR